MKPRSRTPDRRAPKSPFGPQRSGAEKPKHTETRGTGRGQGAGLSQRNQNRTATDDFERANGSGKQRGQERRRKKRGGQGRWRGPQPDARETSSTRPPLKGKGAVPRGEARGYQERRRENPRPPFRDARAQGREQRREPRQNETPRGETRFREPPAREGLVVDRRAQERLRTGNPWVYRSDLISANGVQPGAVAAVMNERGKPLGTALYSSASQIALRMITGARVESDAELLGIVRDRMAAAIQYRERVVEGSDAYRLVFSEADFLPGLIVDRYNDVLTLQVLTQAMDRPEVRAALTAQLVEQLAPAAIIERVEPRIRELEQLPPRESGFLHGNRSATSFTMNGLSFQFDALAGQKTGAFLDQRENYVAAARYARGQALDVFCYQGGFALHLARVCDRVTGVDSSRPALETAERNARANQEQFGGLEIDWLEANAFDVVRDYADTGQQYDTIVVDPPAFAKSKRTLETAMRGYKELNLRALKMLRPGGVLVTCSCSFHVSETDFMQMLAEAAADAHRSLRILERRGAAKDHPALLSFPESQYLKCAIAVAQ